MFHRTLERALCGSGHSLTDWEQWRGASRQQVNTNQGTESLIPDAKFSVDERLFYLEIVKSYESEYSDGESNIEHKIFLYNQYWEQTREEFFVLFVMPTKARVADRKSVV